MGGVRGAAPALSAILAVACVGGSDPPAVDDVPEGVLLAQNVMEKGLETVSGHSSAVLGFLRPDPRTSRGEGIIREFARDEFGLSEADTELLLRRLRENRTGPVGSGEFTPVPQGETILRDLGVENPWLSTAEIQRLSQIEIRVPGQADRRAEGNDCRGPVSLAGMGRMD